MSAAAADDLEDEIEVSNNDVGRLAAPVATTVRKVRCRGRHGGCAASAATGMLRSTCRRVFTPVVIWAACTRRELAV